METIEKFSSIPLIESGLNAGLTIYYRVKKTNRLVGWGLDTSENVASTMLESLRPAIKLIEGPLETIDKLGLKVLEQVEGEFVIFILSKGFSFLINFRRKNAESLSPSSNDVLEYKGIRL